MAKALNIEDTGTLEEIRKRVSRFAEEHPEQIDAFETYTGELSTQGAVPRLTVPTPPNIEFRTPTATDMAFSYEGKTINQICKWGCHFDGRDPAAFLERVGELRQAYGFTPMQLLQGLPELLKGDSLLWFRNYRDSWETWEDFERDFRRQFLPRRYAATLRREITSRHQQSAEKFAQYVTVMMTLMRRAGGYSRDEQLEIIYDNMNPAYKHYVRIDDVRSITELQARAAEYEDIVQEQKEAAKQEKDTATPIVAAVYNKKDCCWRCKQRGHTRAQCRRQAKKFCSQCGRNGVLTKDCHPKAGKASGAGENEAANTTPSPA